MPKGALIDFGPTAGLYYSNGKFYDAAGNRVDPRSYTPPAPPPPAPAPIAPPQASKPFALPSFDASMFGEPPAAQAPASLPPPIEQAPPPPAPLPNFTAPPAETAQPALSPFIPQPAASPLPSFAGNVVAPPPMTQAGVSPVGPTPERVPFVAAPSGGLLEARPYSPAPEMPGYAQARTGVPFRAPEAADLGNLFGRMTTPGQAPQPFGKPAAAEDDRDVNSLLRAVYGRIPF